MPRYKIREHIYFADTISRSWETENVKM